MPRSSQNAQILVDDAILRQNLDQLCKIRVITRSSQITVLWPSCDGIYIFDNFFM